MRLPYLVHMHFSGKDHFEFVAEHLRARSRKELSDEGLHRAGVLVPLIVAGESFELLFTRRTEDVETHKGQVSFPGGMSDHGDRDIIDTALREAEEELGLSRESITVAGLLDDMPTPTGFLITPVVGVLTALPPIHPNAAEVAEVFRVPLSFFADGANARSELRTWRGKTFELWFYETDGHTIWGATAYITRALLTILGML